jgi:hypothetical protein
MRGSGRAACVGAITLLATAGVAAAQPVWRSLDDGAGSLAVAQMGTQARAAQSVNIRTGPGAQFGVVGVLRGGEIVGLAGCDPYWCQLADGRGWVSRQYLAIGSQPAAIAGLPDATAAPAIAPPAPARFTGAWHVVPTAVAAPSTLHRAEADPPEPPKLPPFQLLIAQAGSVVEGVTASARLEGTVRPGGLEAHVAMTTATGERLEGELIVDATGNSLTAVISDNGAPKVMWRATRTILTR